MRGGVLLIQSDGKKIWSVTASGGIEKTVKEGIDMKVSLYLDSLNRNTVPLIRDIPDEKIKKIHSLWHIVRRGLLRHKFAAKATINKREFFKKKTGNLLPGLQRHLGCAKRAKVSKLFLSD